MLVPVALMLMLIVTASVTLKPKLKPRPAALGATLDMLAVLMLQKESPLGADLVRMHCLSHRYCCPWPVCYLSRSHCLSPWLAMDELEWFFPINNELFALQLGFYAAIMQISLSKECFAIAIITS